MEWFKVNLDGSPWRLRTQQNDNNKVQPTLDYPQTETTNPQKETAFKKAKMTQKVKETKRYNNLKNITKKACKSAYNSYLNNIVDPDSQENTKKFWSFIKSQKNDNTGVSPLKAKVA